MPEVLNASIDNEYPNRSSLPIASALTGSGDWETLTLPINCMKPFPGATAINLATVGTPFHLATKEAFNYEITNIKYLLTTSAKPVVDPVTCEAPGGATEPGTDQAQTREPIPVPILAPIQVPIRTQAPASTMPRAGGHRCRTLLLR